MGQHRPLPAELRKNYNSYFSAVALATESSEHICKADDQLFKRNGLYVEPDFPKIFTLNMVAGTYAGFTDPRSILLSQSFAVSLFGNTDPIGRIVRLDNQQDVKVRGVFSGLPSNSRFAGISFFCPWNLLVATNPGVRQITIPG